MNPGGRINSGGRIYSSGRDINLFRLFGIQVSIDFTWFIVFLLFSWTLSHQILPSWYPSYTPLQYWIMGVITALLLFASVLFHEMAHSLVARHDGLMVRKITLFMFGGIANLSEEPRRAGTEFKVAIAGPAFSLTVAGALVALNAGLLLIYQRTIAARGVGMVSAVIITLARLNITLAIFNLVPAFPLDGGRMVRALLWHWTKNLRKATYFASTAGKVFAYFLMTIGFLNALWGELISGVWLIFIGLFLRNAAQMSYNRVLMIQFLDDIPVRELMTHSVVTVTEGTPLDQIINHYFFTHHFVCFPVVSPSGEVKGVIKLDRIKGIPCEQWESIPVEEVMLPLPNSLLPSPDTPAIQALHIMLKHNIGRLPVTVEGRVAGILTRRDIMNLLAIKRELG